MYQDTKLQENSHPLRLSHPIPHFRTVKATVPRQIDEGQVSQEFQQKMDEPVRYRARAGINEDANRRCVRAVTLLDPIGGIRISVFSCRCYERDRASSALDGAQNGPIGTPAGSGHRFHDALDETCPIGDANRKSLVGTTFRAHATPSTLAFSTPRLGTFKIQSEICLTRKLYKQVNNSTRKRFTIFLSRK